MSDIGENLTTLKGFKSLKKSELVHLIESNVTTREDLIDTIKFQKKLKMKCYPCLNIAGKLDVKIP